MISWSSSSSMSCDRGDFSTTLYNNEHLIDVFYLNQPGVQKNISIVIINQQNGTKIKVRGTNDYGFNYSALIDWLKFERIHNEQNLHITFDEFQPQIMDLLNQTDRKQMQLRLEVTDNKAKLVFYEKSRLKILIFLTIDLESTNQKIVIEELTDRIAQLENCNKSLATQLSTTKNNLHHTEMMLKTTITKYSMVEKQFCRDLELNVQTFQHLINTTEAKILMELQRLMKRHQKLLNNLETIKRENCLKKESDAQLLKSFQSLRIENEKQQRLNNNLKIEIDELKLRKNKVEDTTNDLKMDLVAKDAMLESLQNEMGELRRDMQDAALIIVQKTKTNDEIGKDLMDANRILVNVNNQYGVLFNEAEELKLRMAGKDELIRDQAAELDRLRKEYQNLYSNQNHEEMNKLQMELRSAKQRIEELEKQYKDALKLNNLLTKKLSNGEVVDVRNVNFPFPNKP